MISLKPDTTLRKQARAEAREMGVLYGSLTKGRGNKIGCMGEILVQDMIGGQRVGHKNYDYDIITFDGVTVDVKTTQALKAPEPHYVARVYCSEDKREKYETKCDVYYFVRCNPALSFATIVGWLTAEEFFEKAVFTKRGRTRKGDHRMAYADEYSVLVSELNPPSQPLR